RILEHSCAETDVNDRNVRSASRKSAGGIGPTGPATGGKRSQRPEHEISPGTDRPGSLSWPDLPARRGIPGQAPRRKKLTTCSMTASGVWAARPAQRGG